jgi:hypothetical protein
MSQHDRTHHAKIATGKGDPQCFAGTAGGPPKFKVGDRGSDQEPARHVLHALTMVYTRGAVGEVAVVTHESPAPEDEAWGHVDNSEWFYIVRFKQNGPLAGISG